MLVDDCVMVEELAEQIDSYRDVLKGLGEPFPDAFVLRDVVGRRDVAAN
ncbi:MAG: hypothetical protein ACKOZU_11055 [Planctomycetaceae bacterium]